MAWKGTLWRDPHDLTDEEVREILEAGRAHLGPEEWLAEVRAEVDRRIAVQTSLSNPPRR